MVGVTVVDIARQIILDPGRRSSMSDMSQSYMHRIFSAAPDWYVTGINGTTEFVMGNLQMTRLGLAQAQHHDVADYTMPPHRDPLPVPSPLGQLLWDEEYSQILGQSIREHPTLRLMACRSLPQPTRGFLHRDLMSHEALIWAKDVGKRRALRRLTGCIVSGGKEDIVCGVSAAYGDVTDLARRTVGLKKTEAGPGVKTSVLFEPFDIDGPRGEVVTRLEFPMQAYPKALKVWTMSCL